MKTFKYLSIYTVLATGVLVSSCNEDVEKIDNKIYVDGTTEVTSVLILHFTGIHSTTHRSGTHYDIRCRPLVG